jgi:hypothetical protein
MRTLSDVQKRISYFVEEVYHQKRLHSSREHRPSCEFERMLTVTKNPCQDTLITTSCLLQPKGVIRK